MYWLRMFSTARKALAVPDVITFGGSPFTDANAGSNVVPLSRAAFSCAGVAVGLAAASRAMIPVTCGVACEVPLSKPYSGATVTETPGTSPLETVGALVTAYVGAVDRMLMPGAARSTDSAPKFEKLARFPWLSVAATVMTLGRFRESLAGEEPVTPSLSRLTPLLPAA